jgi:hypothetical protein
MHEIDKLKYNILFYQRTHDLFDFIHKKMLMKKLWIIY